MKAQVSNYKNWTEAKIEKTNKTKEDIMTVRNNQVTNSQNSDTGLENSNTEARIELQSFIGEEYEAGKNGNTFRQIAGWTGNPEYYQFKYTSRSNKALFTTSVAAKDQDGQVHWFKLNLWGRRAEQAAETLYKQGKTAFLRFTGKVQHYQCKHTGKIRYSLNTNEVSVLAMNNGKSAAYERYDPFDVFSNNEGVTADNDTFTFESAADDSFDMIDDAPF